MELRADALDALRGLAIMGMILSGQIPFSGPAALPALTSIGALLNRLAVSPWPGFLKGLLVTLLAAAVTAFFTRKKIFWRS